MKKSFFWIIVILLGLLSLTFYSRSTNNGVMLIEDQIYQDMVIAKDINYNNYLSYDIYHMLLSVLNEDMIIVLSFILSIISIIFLTLIFKHYKLNDTLILFIQILFIISPQFISAYSISIKNGFSLSLMLVSYYFLLKSKKIFNLGIFFLIIFSLVDIYNVLISLILIILFSFTERKKWSHTIIIGLVFVIVYLNPIVKYGWPFFNFPLDNLIEFLSDFGGLYGVGVFKFLLGVMGLFIVWKKKYKNNIFVLFSVISIIFAFLFPTHSYIMLPILSILAGQGIYYFYKKKWNIDFMKNLTLIIIVCGLLFSFVSFFNRQTNIYPNSEFLEGLNTIDSQGGSVLSHVQYGNMIEYYTGHISAISYKKKYSNPQQNYLDIITLFNSRDLKETKELFKKYNIKYIFITPEMKDGLVWSVENEGLLFLFRNKDVFEKRYGSDGFEIWEIKNV